MKYIKQLDSVRAIAVLLVIISHWIPENSIINRTPNGMIGVDIFFVLSGFLISGILFNNKVEAEMANVSKFAVAKNFYVRRTLRIFPIYYLTLLLLFIFRKNAEINPDVSFLALATYTTNFHYYYLQAWPGMLSHLWSLAVEEQFYLIWPWIILFTKKKHLLPVIIGFILIGVISQYFLQSIKMGNLLTFTCFDAFGIGALLSWQLTFGKENIKRFYFITCIAATLAMVLFVAGLFFTTWSLLPARTLVAIMSLWLITYIILNKENDKLKFKFILNNKILIFIGKISYGIYLYHNIIPSTLNSKFLNKYFNPLLPDVIYKRHWGELYLLENTIMLMVISWLSYVFIEKRFLRLKKYFDYQNDNSKQNTVSTTLQES